MVHDLAAMAASVSEVIARLRDGDQAAMNELVPLVQAELRQIAQAFLRRQRPDHTLQPTALVNEGFVKLLEGRPVALVDRAHFLALMARVMRQVLVDHARAAAAAKRGGGVRPETWDTNVEIGADAGVEHVQLLELHDALEALSQEHELLGRVVELHYFGGMTAEEVAMVVGRTAHAVRHDLRLARAWLRREMAGEAR